MLEDLAFRLPKLRDLEDDEAGAGVTAMRQHFKWCKSRHYSFPETLECNVLSVFHLRYCKYLYWSSQLKIEVTTDALIGQRGILVGADSDTYIDCK